MILALLSWLAVRYVATVASIGGVTPALQLPLWLVYGVVPVGLALGSIEYALAFFRNLTGAGIHASVDLEEGAEEESGA